MFFYFCKVLFSDFLQFNGNFVDAQNNTEYRDWAPLKTMIQFLHRIYRVSYVLHMLWLEFNFGFSVVFQSRFSFNLFCFSLQ